jgi:hypothetical protein
MACECVVYFVCSAAHIGKLLLEFLVDQGFQESASTPLLLSMRLIRHTFQ